MLDAVQQRGHAIVVFLQNRIKLVIVTLGATDGEPEKSLRCGVHHVIEIIGALLASPPLRFRCRPYRADPQPETQRQRTPADPAAQ